MLCVSVSLWLFFRFFRQIRAQVALIPQRFAGVQQGPHACLGLLLATQRQECFTFQVKDVMLADPGWLRQIATGHHISQFLGNVQVVIADVATGIEGPGSDAQRAL